MLFRSRHDRSWEGEGITPVCAPDLMEERGGCPHGEGRFIRMGINLAFSDGLIDTALMRKLLVAFSKLRIALEKGDDIAADFSSVFVREADGRIGLKPENAQPALLASVGITSVSLESIPLIDAALGRFQSRGQNQILRLKALLIAGLQSDEASRVQHTESLAAFAEANEHFADLPVAA